MPAKNSKKSAAKKPAPKKSSAKSLPAKKTSAAKSKPIKAVAKKSPKSSAKISAKVAKKPAAKTAKVAAKPAPKKLPAKKIAEKKSPKKVEKKVSKTPAKPEKSKAKSLPAKAEKKSQAKETKKESAKKPSKKELAESAKKAPPTKEERAKLARLILANKNSPKEKSATEIAREQAEERKILASKKAIIVRRSDGKNKVTFKVGDYAVYPSHGIGKIIDIEKISILGQELSSYLMYFEKEKLTIKIPTNSAEKIGLRHLISKDQMSEVFVILRSGVKKLKGMWSRRAQEYESKINSGDITLLAEVLRDLTRDIDDSERSYSERIIYETAVYRLASEYAAIYGNSFEEAKDMVIVTAKDKLTSEGKAAQKDDFDDFDAMDKKGGDEDEEGDDDEEEEEEDEDDFNYDFDAMDDDEDDSPKRKKKK